MSGSTFSTEEIRMLAEQERRMDSGEQPFVTWGGSRMAVTPEVMAELGLQRGQSVSDVLARAIMEAHLAACQAQMALQNAVEN